MGEEQVIKNQKVDWSNELNQNDYRRMLAQKLNQNHEIYDKLKTTQDVGQVEISSIVNQLHSDMNAAKSKLIEKVNENPFVKRNPRWNKELSEARKMRSHHYRLF